MYIINHGCWGTSLMFIICKYGDISAGVGILMMLPGYAYIFVYKCEESPFCMGVWHSMLHASC